MAENECKHENEDWPFCEQCDDESWCCFDCGRSACEHNRSNDISPFNKKLMEELNKKLGAKIF